MTDLSYRERAATAVELAEIHLASCRDRRQGLCCSTCSDLAERAERAIRRLTEAA